MAKVELDMRSAACRNSPQPQVRQPQANNPVSKLLWCRLLSVRTLQFYWKIQAEADFASDLYCLYWISENILAYDTVTPNMANCKFSEVFKRKPISLATVQNPGRHVDVHSELMSRFRSFRPFAINS